MLTKRQRIAEWIKPDAKRRAEAEIVARTTRRLFPKVVPPDHQWSPEEIEKIERRGCQPLVFNTIRSTHG